MAKKKEERTGTAVNAQDIFEGKPEAAAENRTPKDPEEQPESRTPEEPEEQPEDRTPEEPEEQPESRTPEEPEEQPESRTPEEPEEQPESRTPEEPEEQPEDRTPEVPAEPESKMPEELEEQSKSMGQAPAEVLFYVTTRENKVALRSTPEFKMDGSNIAGIINEASSAKRMYKVTEVKDGYGKLLYPEGLWICLNACKKH